MTTAVEYLAVFVALLASHGAVYHHGRVRGIEWSNRAFRAARQIRNELLSSNDPVDSPEVQAMLREVMRTGRPMHMRRGEAPEFIDGPPAVPGKGT